MSLYDDLDVKPGTAPSTLSGSGWALASMQKALMQRRQAPSQRAGAGGAGASAPPTLPPVLNLKAKRDTQKPAMGGGPSGGEFRFNQRTGRMERAGGKSINDPTLPVSLDEDYNPFYPNQYEEVVTMVRAKRKMLEYAEQEQQQKEQKVAPTAPAASGHDSDGSFEGSPGRRRSGSDSDQSDHEEEEQKRRMGRGAYIAPPTSLIEQDSKVPEPRPISDTGGASFPFGTGSQPQLLGSKPSLAEKHNVSSAAAKMMARMGYRDGQGLGREGQGMASALSVEKTSKHGGKIVSELDRYKNPSPVIMLTNMVGPGEVDDELEDEIKDECNKYGPVVMVMIYKIPTAGVSAEEAVRIFVEFERLDSSIKAMNELNGRFFGGRTVTCRFYDGEKFKDLEFDGSPLPLELNE